MYTTPTRASKVAFQVRQLLLREELLLLQGPAQANSHDLCVEFLMFGTAVFVMAKLTRFYNGKSGFNTHSATWKIAHLQECTSCKKLATHGCVRFQCDATVLH